MDGDDIVPWLKSDLLSGFSDLLDTEPNNLRMGSAATLGSSDLLSLPPPAMNMDLSSDQVTPERIPPYWGFTTRQAVSSELCLCSDEATQVHTQLDICQQLVGKDGFQCSGNALLIGPSPSSRSRGSKVSPHVAGH